MDPNEDNHPQLSEDLSGISKSQLDELWDNAEDYCVWVRPEDVPSPIEEYADIDHLEGFVSDERYKDIETGSPLTDEETSTLEEVWIERVLEDFGDYDDIKAVAIVLLKILPGDSRCALITRTGGSINGVHTGFEGIFASKKKAIEYLEKNGRTNFDP